MCPSQGGRGLADLVAEEGGVGQRKVGGELSRDCCFLPFALFDDAATVGERPGVAQRGGGAAEKWGMQRVEIHGGSCRDVNFVKDG
ncbi:MAG TPA: hypothetical protein VLF41_01695 [Candidatus Nanoarchaeia archaeon]|nr:hypothetical protein [Candidatus Nanoarchaeia archaeon]